MKDHIWMAAQPWHPEMNYQAQFQQGVESAWGSWSWQPGLHQGTHSAGKEPSFKQEESTSLLRKPPQPTRHCESDTTALSSPSNNGPSKDKEATLSVSGWILGPSLSATHFQGDRITQLLDFASELATEQDPRGWVTVGQTTVTTCLVRRNWVGLKPVLSLTTMHPGASPYTLSFHL